MNYYILGNAKTIICNFKGEVVVVLFPKRFIQANQFYADVGKIPNINDAALDPGDIINMPSFFIAGFCPIQVLSGRELITAFLEDVISSLFKSLPRLQELVKLLIRLSESHVTRMREREKQPCGPSASFQTQRPLTCLSVHSETLTLRYAERRPRH